MASNPTTRFHSFSLLACHHGEQRERAFQCVPGVSIFLSWTSCRRDKQSTHAFPSVLPKPHVDLACSSHSRFHLVVLGSSVGIASSPSSRFHFSFLGRLTTWQATRPRVSTAFLRSHVSTANSANARFFFFNAFPFFVSGPVVDATISTHKRFHLSFLRRMSTWHAAHTRVSKLFLFRLSVWRTVQTHVSIVLSSAASQPGTDNRSAHARSVFFFGSPVDATLLVAPLKE